VCGIKIVVLPTESQLHREQRRDGKETNQQNEKSIWCASKARGNFPPLQVAYNILVYKEVLRVEIQFFFLFSDTKPIIAHISYGTSKKSACTLFERNIMKINITLDIIFDITILCLFREGNKIQQKRKKSKL
jgi:hypothetical protein